jgi:ketosteroid isomerase-like protein
MALVLSACAKTSPEQALREAVGGLQAAIESRDAAGVQDSLAEDFIGPDGLDRAGARRMAALYLMRHDRIGVTPGPLDITLQDTHARVRFTAVLTGGSGRLLPETGDVYKVETGWRLEAGRWKMTSATWTAQR